MNTTMNTIYVNSQPLRFVCLKGKGLFFLADDVAKILHSISVRSRSQFLGYNDCGFDPDLVVIDPDGLDECLGDIVDLAYDSVSMAVN
jgi:hypothetical protein